MKAIIVIPAFNPDEKMIELIDCIQSSEQMNLDLNSKIIVVNDGSSNEYEDFFIKAKERGCIVINHTQNMGKGKAIKTALRYIKERYSCETYYSSIGIVIADADGQHSISDLIKVLCMLNDNMDSMVLGSRRLQGNIPFRSRFGNIVTRYIFYISTGKKLSDTQTGLRAFSTHLLNNFLEIPGERYEYEMNVLLKLARNKMNICEVGIECIYIEGNKSSHFRPIADSFRIYGEIIKYAAVSIASFIIDYIVFVLTNVLFDNLVVANGMARIFSSTFNFSANRKYIFKSKNNFCNDVVKYFTLVLFVLIINTSLLKMFVNVFGVNRYVAKIIVETGMFLFNFMIQKLFVFNNNVKDN